MKISGQFIGDLLDSNRESEYDKVISLLNVKSDIYKANRVKMANFLEENTHTEGVYYIDTNGLIYKIVQGSTIANIEYHNKQVSRIRVVDTPFHQDYIFDISYQKGQMEKILVTLPNSRYAIGFKYSKKDNRTIKTIYYIDSGGEKTEGLTVVSIKYGNVEIIESYVHNKRFKNYLVDSVSVMDEKYERSLNGSVETVKNSSTGILKSYNNRYIQSEVQYSSALPYSVVKIVCFNELKLPVRTYLFTEGGDGIYSRPDIIISKYKNGLLEDESMAVWDNDGKEIVNKIKPFVYKYEYND